MDSSIRFMLKILNAGSQRKLDRVVDYAVKAMKRIGKPEMAMIKMEANRARQLAIEALFRLRRYQKFLRNSYVNNKRRTWNLWLKPLIFFRLMTPYTNADILKSLNGNGSLNNLHWNVSLTMPPNDEDYENCHKILILAKQAQKNGEKKIWITKVDFADLMGVSQYY